MKIEGFEEAKRILGTDVIGPKEISATLGFDPIDALSTKDRDRVLRIPFHREILVKAAHDGQLLVLRLTRDERGNPLTILNLAERFAKVSEGRLEKPVAEAWFAREPFANHETCNLGWALVEKSPLAETRNLSYPEQTETLRARRERLGLALRRRSAVEIVYDTLLCAAARQERLLESDWDWSSSPTMDGGWVSAGEFSPAGLRLVGFSKAVRFDTLGLCANLDGSQPALHPETAGV